MNQPSDRQKLTRSRILDGVGNTPLLELPNISKDVAPVQILMKAEWYNPGGSVKDRPALNMILDGEKRGALTKDKTILDATSGNTGIAYAMIGAALGYQVKLCVPANMGKLRVRILKAYGAELVMTNPIEGSDGAIKGAIALNEEDPDRYFYPDQYSNPANWQAHYNGTAPEIWEQTNGEITHFVAGLGTSGTFCGTGKRLKEFNPGVRIISFQPESPMHGMEGLKHYPTSIVPKIFEPGLADDERVVRTEDAQAMTRRIAKEEGILIGVSGGAAVQCGYEIAKTLDQGVVVVICPDGAQKYLDFPFWDRE